MISKNLTRGKFQFYFNFISTKDNDEEQAMHSKRDKIKIMINDQADAPSFRSADNATSIVRIRISE